MAVKPRDVAAVVTDVAITVLSLIPNVPSWIWKGCKILIGVGKSAAGILGSKNDSQDQK